MLTSNGERDFPAAFLRRCIRLRMPDPTVGLLTTIVTAHLGPEVATRAERLIADFAARAQQSLAYSADQLMNALFLVGSGPGGEVLADDAEARDRVQELVLKKLIADRPETP